MLGLKGIGLLPLYANASSQLYHFVGVYEDKRLYGKFPTVGRRSSISHTHPPISLHMHYLLVEFSLHEILKVFENAKHFGFVFEEEDPCVSTIIIDEGNIISTIANRNRGSPPHIRVNQIKGSTAFIIQAGIGKLTTLCSLARVTHRLNITI
jgi:hypothetical protein